MAPPKKPRRTAQRILDTSLDLFNRFGEPNVSTTLISAELNISPGNLYYHYPAKDTLINALFARFEADLDELLHASDNVRHVEDAWFYFHSLFERMWSHRFIYRDLNDLLSKNRLLETRFQALLARQQGAMRDVLSGLKMGGVLRMDAREATPTAATMVVLLSYWLSFEYVKDPRRALEPEQAQTALLRGAFHVLNVLLPYLEPASREHLLNLAAPYLAASAVPHGTHAPTS